MTLLLHIAAYLVLLIAGASFLNFLVENKEARQAFVLTLFIALVFASTLYLSTGL